MTSPRLQHSSDATGFVPPASSNVVDVKREPRRFVLEDELSIRTRQQFKIRVVDALAEGDREIIADASTCGYIDSSGLGVLVAVNKKCRDAGGTLTIVGLNEELRVWMALVRLDAVLTIDPPITDAERAGG